MDNPLDEEYARRNKSDFKFYRDFHNLEEAENFTKLLDDKNIPFLLESSGTLLDVTIVGDGLIPKAILKILPNDFKRVNQVIAEQIGNLDFAELSDHFLNQFETEELEDILENQDEWNIENISIAKIILKHRGIEIDEEELDELRQESLGNVREGKEGSKFWITFYAIGIAVGMFTSLFLLIAGFGMSVYYAYGKNNDPDGNRYYVFEEGTRQIGVIMLYGGIMLVIIEILFLYWIV